MTKCLEEFYSKDDLKKYLIQKWKEDYFYRLNFEGMEEN